jgi:hypothetical protein
LVIKRNKKKIKFPFIRWYMGGQLMKICKCEITKNKIYANAASIMGLGCCGE